MALNFHCIGIIRKKASNKYEFVIRWFLNDPENKETTYFPHPDGKFLLEIRSKNQKEYVLADGTISVGRPNDNALPVATPLNYLMILPIQNNQIPQRPIDPNDPKNSGLGIYHILAKTRASYYSKKIKDRTLLAITKVNKSKSGKLLQAVSAEEYAAKFTHYLIDNSIRPSTLQAIYIKELDALKRTTFEKSKRDFSAFLSGLFSFHIPNDKKDSKHYDKNLEKAWENAVFLKELVKDVEFLKDIHKLVSEPEGAKSQFTLLGLQGMEVIDYWCSPKVNSNVRDEAQCGKKYNANEAMGLGMTIGDLDETQIQSWLGAQEDLLINVTYVPPTIQELMTSAIYDWKNNHDPQYLEDIPPITSSTAIITNQGTNSLQNAIGYGSSCPPDSPKDANIEYDLFLRKVLTDFKDDEDLQDKIKYGENMEVGTGDGRVMFKLSKPDPKPFAQRVNKKGLVRNLDASSIITGINVYGMWEPQDNQSPWKAYFNDLNLDPPTDELKQWLITRRYSYNNDLSAYFDSANPNIALHQKSPCISPAFQSPGQVTNVEKILDVEAHNRVIYEQMPHRKGNEADDQTIIFSMNVREGFRNAYNNQIPSTWDKFPMISTETDWQPALWKDNNRHTQPQGYRFWASSVDIFGQESLPVPILNPEIPGESAKKLFQFKYRAALQAPPSNNEENKEFITVKYLNDKINVKWESPFEGNLGNFSNSDLTGGISSIKPISKALKRINKDLLIANVVYLRKLHVKDAQFFGDDKIDLFITDLQQKLPKSFRDEKWHIGFKEIFKHNRNWTVFQSFEQLTSNTTGYVWTHDLLVDGINKGYDYMVLINFNIKSNSKQFWVADAERRLHICEPSATKNKFNYHNDKTIEDCPTISNIAYTNSLTIENVNNPKMMEKTESVFLPARPVLGIQGLNRDLILSNILKIPNKIKKVEVPSESGTQLTNAVVFEYDQNGVHLTAGQLTMMQAAFKRIGNYSDTDLAAATEILSNEIETLNKNTFEIKKVDDEEYYLLKPNSENKIITNDLIGFRGLYQMKLRYNSIFSNLSEFKNESQAIKYHIYQTRIPLRDDVENINSFSALGYTKISNLKYSNVTFGANIFPDKYKVPILVKLQYVQGFSLSVLKSIILSGASYNVELNAPLYTNASGQLLGMFFIISSQVYEDEIVMHQKMAYEKNLLLPVGGGYTELFVWTIRTSSALGLYSNESESLFQIFRSSILPSVPEKFTASITNTYDEKIKYALDPKANKIWLPLKLQTATLGQLQMLPRIILKWSSDKNLATDVNLAIERDFRTEELSITSKARIVDNWELASKIEKGSLIDPDDNPDGLILAEYLARENSPSLYQWLFEMSRIEIKGAMSIRNAANPWLLGPESNLYKKNPELSVVNGLLKDSDNSPLFIDYFNDNEDLVAGMDTFRSYNYRLSSYIDLDPMNEMGLDGIGSKYLFSRPTEWAGWVRPVFPEIAKIELAAYAGFPSDDLFAPEIELNFQINNVAVFKKKTRENTELYYRILVKREIKNSISTHLDKPEGTMFFEIGELLDLHATNFEISQPIIDRKIEREDLITNLQLTYRIEISVIAKADGIIRIIRKPKIQDFKINVGGLQNGKEIKIPLQFTIK